MLCWVPCRVQQYRHRVKDSKVKHKSKEKWTFRNLCKLMRNINKSLILRPQNKIENGGRKSYLFKKRKRNISPVSEADRKGQKWENPVTSFTEIASLIAMLRNPLEVFGVKAQKAPRLLCSSFMSSTDWEEMLPANARKCLTVSAKVTLIFSLRRTNGDPCIYFFILS